MKFKDLEIEYSRLKSYDPVWNNMPALLRKGVFAFASKSEKFVLAYSAVTALASIMTRVTTRYNKKDINPMLYLGVVAAPASNKSVVNYGREMLKGLQLYIKAEYEKAVIAYKTDYASWLTSSKIGKEPVHPPYQNIVISGDITKPKLLQQLQDNIGVPSIIIADEIDILTNSSRGEHGTGLSQLLRTAYHHDTIEQQLKAGNQHYIILRPQLGVIMAGTPKQMATFIGNIENGLYSRFLILQIDDGPIWNDVSPSLTSPDIKSVFSELSGNVLDLFHFLHSNPLQITFSANQWEVVNDFGKHFIGRLYNKENEHLASIVKRHSLMTIKIAMVLTALRAKEISYQGDSIECLDSDIELSFMMMRRSFDDSRGFFKKLPGGAISKTVTHKQAAYSAMKKEFKRVDFITVAKANKISVRTADRFIEDLIEGGQLRRMGHGLFEKIEPVANVANDETDEDNLK